MTDEEVDMSSIAKLAAMYASRLRRVSGGTWIKNEIMYIHMKIWTAEEKKDIKTS
jgi:hypothetical protein